MMECVVDAQAQLGECPIWDGQDNCLYWVDSLGRLIHRFEPGTGRDTSWATPEKVGSIGLCEGGGLVAALEASFAFYRPGATEPDRTVAIAGEPDNNRLNDGRVDPAGRFWAGSMTGPTRVPTGSLFCLDRNLDIHRRVRQLIISNALCWSLDGTTMYHADTIRRTVWAWDFHADGSIANQRIFAEGDALGGPPDGAVVDAEGCLWIAHFGAWTIGRYDSSGRLVRSITLPVQNPTCPGFGGAGLSTLYVTSARLGLNEEQLAGQPLAGGVFALDVGVSGRPEFRFDTAALAG